MPERLSISPPPRPVDGLATPPGSKSLTNRALVAAALARGTSTLSGALVADDTLAMRRVLGGLGVSIEAGDDGRGLVVHGCAGRPGAATGRLDAGSAGTVARFVPFVLALAAGESVLDGSAQMRGRPMETVVGALRDLGAAVACEEEDGHLPLRVTGTGGALAPRLALRADVSSQAASGAMLGAPCSVSGLALAVDGPVVSRPYLDMTAAVMRAFGADVAADGAGYRVAPGGYVAAEHAIEPDASAASYAFGAAAVTGGRVRVDGLGTGSPQGDLAFVGLLERMGATVTMDATATTVTATGTLRGIEADMRECSDVAQTLAVVAAVAEGPTRITGIGFIRRKETDRIGAMVTELRRAGVGADEEEDGLVVRPAPPRPAVLQTYDDHRMAMSLSLLGLVAGGIVIADPGCVAKSYPGYFEDLAALTGARVAPYEPA